MDFEVIYRRQLNSLVNMAIAFWTYKVVNATTLPVEAAGQLGLSSIYCVIDQPEHYSLPVCVIRNIYTRDL